MSLCCDPLFLICETVEWSQIHLQEFQSGETPLTSGTKNLSFHIEAFRISLAISVDFTVTLEHVVVITLHLSAMQY